MLWISPRCAVDIRATRRTARTFGRRLPAGGEGSPLTANPSLRGVLFDLPHVVTRGKDRLERGWPTAARSSAAASSRRCPRGADAYLPKGIVPDWDDASAVEILSKCRAAMGDAGRLVLIEPIIRPGNEPDPAKFSDLNMLVMLGGRERTADDFERLYAEAGFRLTDVVRTGSAFAIIEGAPV